MYSKFVSFVKTKPLKFLYIVLSILVLKEVIYIQTFRDAVSPIADGYSEANAVRGAVFFHEVGFNKTSGLPVLCYSDLLKYEGLWSECISLEVYTHYPPGPEYINWFWMNVFGKGKFNETRYVHILLSFIIGLFFLKTTFNFMGGGLKGLTLGLMLILPPMFSNYMHGLHYQQPAFLILQLQIIFSLLYSEKKKASYLLAFLIFGFIQGWLSFDYAFLATLFFIPFYILLEKEKLLKLRHLISIGLASGLSFTAAHILHFLQVINYLGSFEAALRDFAGSAAHRATNAVSFADKPNPKFTKDIGPLTVMKDYLYRVAGRGKYLSVNLMNFIWIILGLRFVKKLETKKFRFEFSVTTRDLMVLLSAVVISALWSIVMRQHAHIHGFIARHYYFCYFFCCLILVKRTSVLKKD
ncbi:MAG: hypothetical protein ACLGHN_04710 [Bacteriovoracia bacterium]